MKKSLSLLVASLFAGLLPMSPAVAAPTIAFLNPSPMAAGQVPELSDKGGNPVHLVAWVRDVPASPLVEFEISGTPGTLTAPHAATIDARRVGSTDTWEAFFVIPETFPNGTYTVIARLFSNLQQSAPDATQVVTINHTGLSPADTVEMTWPSNGESLGFFTPKDKPTNTLITGVASTGTDQVRALYSLSNPGETPEWKRCGAGAPGEAGITTIRCTLAEGDTAAAVTAVAMVANQTPRPSPPDPLADDASDAHRIVSYVQTPAFVGMNPQSVQAQSGTCQLVTASVFDQLGRAIAGANVDVHAYGPTDQLAFATFDASPFSNTTHPYQAPEGHVSDKSTIRCSDKTQINAKQGVHRLIGTPDRMHIESMNGSDNNGSFVFALFHPSGGGTNISAWADVNDDDSQALSEASGQAQIGWDVAPPPPQREIFIDPDTSTAEVGTCQQLTVVVRDGGSPVVGQNIDIHITGPDATASFCDPPGYNESRRDPDQGGHVGGSHTDSNAKHLEGETDSFGRFLFGVTAASEGRTDVGAWIDENDDDLQGIDEAAAPAHVAFEVDGDRTISLEANKNRVRKGRRVRLSGAISGSEACSGFQTVKLKARPRGGSGGFKVIAKKKTDAEGSFVFRPRVRKTKDYKAMTPRNGPCEFARSGPVTVRVRN